jgi:hypothetical protein
MGAEGFEQQHFSPTHSNISESTARQTAHSGEVLDMAARLAALPESARQALSALLGNIVPADTCGPSRTP